MADNKQDCGCNKKIVDKIYIENSCCGKQKETTGGCDNKKSCTSCGKQIDFIDTGMQAENVYNYIKNTNFNASSVIISEGDMISSVGTEGDENSVLRQELYTILDQVDLKTEVLVQLKKSINGLYGLKSIASIKKEGNTYIVAYVRQYENTYQNIPDKDTPIVTDFCIYKSDSLTATYNRIDITAYTYEEIINILSRYATEEWVSNQITQVIENYYNKQQIDEFLSNIHSGEDCLFKVGQGTDSTRRADDGSQAIGEGSFAIQSGSSTGSKAQGAKSIAMQGGEALDNYSIAIGNTTLVKTDTEEPHSGSVAIMQGANGGNIIGSKILNSNRALAIGGSRITGNSTESVALQGSNIDQSLRSFASANGYIFMSDNSISIGTNSKSSKITSGQNYSITNLHDNIGVDQRVNNNISINGGTASGKYSTAIGPECYSTNVGSFTIGEGSFGGANFNSGYYAHLLGYDSEIGRYRKLNQNNEPQYVYGDNEYTKGQHSNIFGPYNSIYGGFNSVFGERHFIRGNHNSSFGSGNTVSNNNSDSNLLFGNRNKVENTMYSISGGLYTQMFENSASGGINTGSIAIGDTLKIENLYLKNINNNNEEFIIQYKDPNNANNYLNLQDFTRLGKSIDYSNIIDRRGLERPLGSISFVNKQIGGEWKYPGIKTITKSGSNIVITLDGCNKSDIINNIASVEDHPDLYQCSIKFSDFSNKVANSGVVVLGTGNRVDGYQSAAIGTGLTVSNDNCVAFGRFNDSAVNQGESMLFSIGNGNLDSKNYIINKKNAFEIIRDDSTGAITDIRFALKLNDNVPEKMYSLKDIIVNIGAVGQDIVSNSANTIQLLQSQGTFLSSMPGYNSRGYVQATETTVYDPNKVLPQEE